MLVELDLTLGGELLGDQDDRRLRFVDITQTHRPELGDVVAKQFRRTFR